MYSGQRRDKEAADDFLLNFFPLSGHLKDTTEAFLVPYAYTELGEIFRRQGDHQTSQAYFVKAKANNLYGFQKYLHYRIERAIEEQPTTPAKPSTPSDPSTPARPSPGRPGSPAQTTPTQVVVHIHKFQATWFNKPTWCDSCKGFVVNPLGKQGYTCLDCGFKIHNQCLKDFPTAKVVQ